MEAYKFSLGEEVTSYVFPGTMVVNVYSDPLKIEVQKSPEFLQRNVDIVARHRETLHADSNISVLNPSVEQIGELEKILDIKDIPGALKLLKDIDNTTRK